MRVRSISPNTGLPDVDGSEPGLAMACAIKSPVLQEQDILRNLVVPCEENPLPSREVEVDEFTYHYTASEKPHIQVSCREAWHKYDTCILTLNSCSIDGHSQLHHQKTELRIISLVCTPKASSKSIRQNKSDIFLP